MQVAQCARLQGHSVVICRCKTADGFLPCPADALGQLTPTYPPVAYERARAALQAPPSRSVPHLVYSGGYTGSICDQCGSARMRRSGTCETCEDCGNAGGCG
jgi:hypothetical protein